MIVMLLIADAVVALAIGYLVGCHRANERAVDGILDGALDPELDHGEYLAALRPEQPR